MHVLLKKTIEEINILLYILQFLMNLHKINQVLLALSLFTIIQ